jgi:hypothetical protein
MNSNVKTPEMTESVGMATPTELPCAWVLQRVLDLAGRNPRSAR